MFIKKPNYRKFDYQPRYYSPTTDEAERRKRKLGFRSNKNKSTYSTFTTKSPLLYIVMAGFILYLFLKWQGII